MITKRTIRLWIKFMMFFGVMSVFAFVFGTALEGSKLGLPFYQNVLIGYGAIMVFCLIVIEMDKIYEGLPEKNK